LRPQDQTGTEVLTWFHKQGVLKAEVVSCFKLSHCAGNSS